MAAGDIPEALADVICGGIMNDPVVAEDEKTYDRESLSKWMAYCRGGLVGNDGAGAGANNSSGLGDQRPVLSPWSREPMGDTVTPNRERNQVGASVLRLVDGWVGGWAARLVFSWLVGWLVGWLPD